MSQYPVSGPRQSVYSLMRSLGFVMAGHSDKLWTRADGLEASIYGSGSQVQVNRVLDDGVAVVFDGPLHMMKTYLP